MKSSKPRKLQRHRHKMSPLNGIVLLMFFGRIRAVYVVVQQYKQFQMNSSICDSEGDRLNIMRCMCMRNSRPIHNRSTGYDAVCIKQWEHKRAFELNDSAISCYCFSVHQYLA